MAARHHALTIALTPSDDIIAIIFRDRVEVIVANLVVRNLDQHIVDALKKRAAKHGRSMEAEHRVLLEEALFAPKGKSFSEVLATMPNVGQDKDFERVEDAESRDHVFD